MHRSLIIWFGILIIVMLISMFWNLGLMNNELNRMILVNVRLPRILEALITGAVLTLSGQMYQIVLNNPLADSFTLGLASGSTFGAALAIFAGINLFWMPISSMIFSVVTLAIVLFISYIVSKNAPIRITIITGIMIGALFNALLYVLILLQPNKLNSIANYMFGGFSGAEAKEIIFMLILVVPFIVMLFLFSSQIKLLQVGEIKSQSLGLNVRVLIYSVLMIDSLISGVVIAFVGIIGFIGMIIPQLIRRYYHHYKLRYQMLLNLIIGAAMMIFADFIGANILNPIQIPASIILALLGIPTLFIILMKSIHNLR